jgi:hypothetical protein
MKISKKFSKRGARMKLLFLALIMILPGWQTFAQSTCGGDIVGTWNAADQEQFIMNSDCTFKYIGVGGCQSSGTYNPIPDGQGSITGIISTSTGGKCLPVGNIACACDLTATTFSIDCGDGTSSFVKQ